jgi:hypothetical protein
MNRRDNAVRNLAAILADQGAETVWELSRYVYKFTDCGALVGVMVYHEGDEGTWVFGSDIAKLKGDDGLICALSVSSIVEGVEQCTETYAIDLFDERFATPADAVKAFAACVAEVEKEAQAIWNATHGCPTCAGHHGKGEGNDGVTAVWTDCPDCNGLGEVI